MERSDEWHDLRDELYDRHVVTEEVAIDLRGRVSEGERTRLWTHVFGN